MDNLPDHNVAKSFFTELVSITRRKCQWQDLDKTDREAFETWRRDAGEVIIGSYYILREEMLKHLVDTLIQPTWQETESGLHLLRYCSEGIPLGEEESLPRLFSDRILSQLSDDRLRSTTICVIRELVWIVVWLTQRIKRRMVQVPSRPSTSRSLLPRPIPHFSRLALCCRCSQSAL